VAIGVFPWQCTKTVSDGRFWGRVFLTTSRFVELDRLDWRLVVGGCWGVVLRLLTAAILKGSFHIVDRQNFATHFQVRKMGRWGVLMETQSLLTPLPLTTLELA